MVKHLIDLEIFNAAKIHASHQNSYNKMYKEYQICNKCTSGCVFAEESYRMIASIFLSKWAVWKIVCGMEWCDSALKDYM